MTHKSENLRKLAKVIEYRTVRSGYDCYKQGEYINSMNFLMSGKIEIKMESKKGEVSHVGSVEPGEHFGEHCLLVNGAREGTTKLFSSTFKKDKKAYGNSNVDVESDVGTNGDKADHNKGNNEEQNDAREDDNDKDNKKNLKTRKFVPLRECYHCTEHSEILLVLQDDFNLYLKDICNNMQKEKFQILKRSRIFKGWKTDALIRLARMGRMKTIPRKTMLIEQVRRG